MSARAAPTAGAVLGLALLGAGTCRALSLRSSAAETFLGDAAPGTTVVYSHAAGARLRVENSGPDPVRIEFKVVSPPSGGLKDGYDPWPYPVRVEASRAELKPGDGAKVELAVKVPKDAALSGGQYEFDVLATGYDRAGASLTLKTRVLLSVGAPLAEAGDVAADGSRRSGFSLSPLRAGPEKVPWERKGSDPGGGTTLKLINAGDADATAAFTPARTWNKDARIADGYEPAPNPRWLRFDPGVVKIRAGAVGRARIWAAVPRQARYAGRRWAFVAAIDVVTGGVKTRRYFVLLAQTQEQEEDMQAR